ncbi:MAG: response regulator [Clostridiaceae bacterium]|nr:response regulator [Clostridiaceae bacterium]
MFRVLIADDENMSLISTERSFDWEKYGFECPLKTTDPYEAQELLSTQRIDAAFLDIRMPGLSGLDIVQECRRRKIETEFIMVSGYSDFSYAKSALQLGVLDFCVKPIQTDETSDILPKLAQRLWQVRLQNDVNIYNQLKNNGNTAATLTRCGLTSAGPYFSVAEIRSQEKRSIEARLFDSSQEMTLLLSDTQAVKIISSDESFTDKEIDLGADSLVVICSLQGLPQQLSTVLKRLHIEANHAPPATRLVRMDSSDLLAWNESFLNLLQYMEHYYADDLSLNDLACRFNLNYTYCSELFTKVMGVSFTKYLNSLRLSKACRMLRQEDRTLEEISREAGFNNYHYFTSVFKKVYSMTPNQYKKEQPWANHQNTP